MALYYVHGPARGAGLDPAQVAAEVYQMAETAGLHPSRAHPTDVLEAARALLRALDVTPIDNNGNPEE